MQMNNYILACWDQQNSHGYLYGGVHICTTLCLFNYITLHVKELIYKCSKVDFLAGHRLGMDIFCQHRLTGQVLFPNSKNSLGPCRIPPLVENDTMTLLFTTHELVAYNIVCRSQTYPHALSINTSKFANNQIMPVQIGNESLWLMNKSDTDCILLSWLGMLLSLCCLRN